MHLYLEVVLISCVFYGKTVRSGQLVNHDYFQSRALQEHIEGNVGSVQNSEWCHDSTQCEDIKCQDNECKNNKKQCWIDSDCEMRGCNKILRKCNTDECHFEPVLVKDCPSNLIELMSCSKDMNHTQMCEADKVLPNGLRDIDVNNCKVSQNETCSPYCEYDVFKCLKKQNYPKETDSGCTVMHLGSPTLHERCFCRGKLYHSVKPTVMTI